MLGHVVFASYFFAKNVGDLEILSSKSNHICPSFFICSSIVFAEPDKPAKKEKRSASEKSPKEKKKREKKSSLQTVVTSPSPEEEVPQPASSSKVPKVDATQTSHMVAAEVKPKLKEPSTKPQATPPASAPAQAQESSDKLPAPKVGSFFNDFNSLNLVISIVSLLCFASYVTVG